MIPITQAESFKIRKLSPSTFITMVNKDHKSKNKNYYMTCERNALELLVESNIYARQELYEILQGNYLDSMRRKDFKKANEIKIQMNHIKELGM